MEKITKKLEVRYGLVQGFYWIATCALNGYITVYLTYKRLTDYEIGLTSALIAILSICIQLVVSRQCDYHPSLEIKYVIVIMYMISLIFTLIFNFMNLPNYLLLIIYSLAASIQNSEYGLLNSLYVKYANSGIEINYGFSRCFGSVGYAVIAYFLGNAVKIFDAKIIIYTYILFVLLSIVSVLVTPKIENNDRQVNNIKRVSYIDLIRNNRVLLLFLIASTLSAIGSVSISLYLIRIIENVGGNTTHLGVAMLIQSGIEIPAMIYSKKIVKYFKPVVLIVVSFMATTLKIIFLSKAMTISMIYISMTISILCYGIFGVASVLFVNEIVKKDESVRGQSLVTLCYNGGLGTIMGSIIAGKVITIGGLDAIFMFAKIIELFAVCIMLCCLIDYLRRNTLDNQKKSYDN